MPRRITVNDLRGACKEHRALFEATFPDGAEVTVENVHRARAAGINLAFAENLIPFGARAGFRTAMANANASAWAADVRAAALPELERDAALSAARAEYERVHAETLVAALNHDGGDQA